METDAKQRIREVIKEAFTQLTEGCGRPVCFNKDCGNYPFGIKLTTNEAASYAIRRYTQKLEVPDPFLTCEELPAMSGASEATPLLAIFGHLDVLGATFLKGAVTKTDPGLDFEEVERTFQQAQDFVQSGVLPENWLQTALNSLIVGNFTKLFLPRALLVLLEAPDLLQPEQTDTLVQIVHLAIDHEDAYVRVQLVEWLQGYTTDHLLRFIYPLQQFITLQICENKANYMHPDVVAAVHLLDILNSANVSEQVSYKEFYNDAVNKEMDMREQFKLWWRSKDESEMADLFSFVRFPWILDSASKSELLHFDSAIQQHISQRRSIHELAEMGGLMGFMPYLILEVRRENLIEDTIVQLVHGDSSLQKPLKVHFVNEEGVDGGGVQKEFFQLIVRELFDPKFSMFTYHEETRFFWFNADTIAPEDEFELVGLILGLAIYNFNIIDVHLPLAVYKKLVGTRTTIEDLAMFNPMLAKSLKEVLVMEGDLETILCRNFTVETQAYGETRTHELKPGGAQIPLTSSNRQEYVDLYVDWMLNASFRLSFEAFRRGFLKVCGGEVLKFFRAEELELLVCGNPILDFYELERACIYEDGYNKDSRSCQMLWKVLHSLSEDQKKKFLFFVTGSDRAPINGLGSLRFVISRNGPDSDRLMTAHTCFNHLLLPEYTSEKKTRDMLLLAINNSEGFGLR